MRIRTAIIGAVVAASPLALAVSPSGAADPQVSAFWQTLNTLQHTSGTCVDLTESTHSTPETEQAVVYGGSCLSAFVLALDNPGLAFEYGTSTAPTDTSTVTTGAPATDDPAPGTDLSDVECVVVIPGTYPVTFSAGPADSSGSCAAYVSQYPSTFTITPTNETVTTEGS